MSAQAFNVSFIVIIYIMIIHTSNKIFIIFIVIFTCCYCKEYFYSPLNLYIGDGNSSNIIKGVAERRQQIGILFTNKYCRQCYLYQVQMVEIISKLWKEYKIKIYRCQLPNNVALQEQFNIKRFPIMHFVLPYRGSYHIYQNYEILTLSSAIKIVSKIKYSLKKYELSQKQRNNVIFVNIQKLFFVQEDEIIDLYSLNPVYLNLPYIVFAEHKKMQTMLINDKVSEHQLSNCLVYLKRQRKCFTPTSVHQVAYVLSLINYQQVIEFNQKTYKNYQELSLNRYIFIAVLDSIFKRESSRVHIEMLNNLLQKKQLRSKITIFWMQTQLNKQKLTQLGFKQTDHPPLFSQFDLTNAPKKILKNKFGKPIFDQKSIQFFIKDIIMFDQKEQLIKLNRQLLQQSLERLKIIKQYKIIDSKESMQTQTYFILSFPQIEYQLLGDNKIFYKMILNYRFLIERVNRFTQRKINQNYLTFDKYGCNNNKRYGLFLIKQLKCYELSNQIIFSQEKVSKIVQKTFDLPDFYWINQDDYETYLLDEIKEEITNRFIYHYIDV